MCVNFSAKTDLIVIPRHSNATYLKSTAKSILKLQPNFIGLTRWMEKENTIKIHIKR